MSSCQRGHRGLRDRRSRRARSPLTAALLCTLLGLGATAAAAEGPGGHGPETTSARVARLHQEAAEAGEAYELGRREADRQRQRAVRAQELLLVERARAKVLRRDLGQLARRQYREGGGLPYAARMLRAGGPEQLLRGSRMAAHISLAVETAVARSQGAQRRLLRSERAAATAQRTLDRQNTALDQLKQRIEDRLAQARWALQGEADESVTAGRCRGAERPADPAEPVAEPWVPPVGAYRLSAGFDRAGARWSHRHTGQDFAVPIGTPVRAVGGGRVVRVSCGGGFGIEVVIAHPNGYFTQYAHLAAPAVDQGERVRTGQWIGQSGTSGNSTGPHLHFEVRLTEAMGSAVDPVPWLAERGVPVVEVSGRPESAR